MNLLYKSLAVSTYTGKCVLWHYKLHALHVKLCTALLTCGTGETFATRVPGCINFTPEEKQREASENIMHQDKCEYDSCCRLPMLRHTVPQSAAD